MALALNPFSVLVFVSFTVHGLRDACISAAFVQRGDSEHGRESASLGAITECVVNVVAYLLRASENDCAAFGVKSLGANEILSC